MKIDEWRVRHLAKYVKITRPTKIGKRLRWKAGAAVVPRFPLPETIVMFAPFP
jgi:hypothetical protein